jgi:hypothetical protein
LVTLLVTSGIGFFITQNRINSQAEESFVDRLRKTDGMASKVRTFFSQNAETYVSNHNFKQISHGSCSRGPDGGTRICRKSG